MICEVCGGKVEIVKGGRGIGTDYYYPENKTIPHSLKHGKIVCGEDCRNQKCILGPNTCGLCGGLDMRIMGKAHERT